MFRELVRKNKQLSMQECVEVLKSETRGVLSVLGDGGYPYGMPMNHWYNEEDGNLYFHCGNVGHRLEALQACDKVSFCTYDKGFRSEGQWAWKVKSVIVFGKVEFIEDEEKVIEISKRLSYKFTDDENYIEEEIRKSLKGTLMFALKIEHISGKIVKEK